MTEATVSPYVVRLVMTAQAATPQEAVAMFIDELVQKGLRNWVYGVLDGNGDTVAELNGHGEDMQELIQRLQQEDDDGDLDERDDEPVTAPAAPSDTDDDLHRLAQDLNDGNT